MAVRKEYRGRNEDGTPHFAYISDDPSDHLVVTGDIFGTVEVDGEQVDVTESVIVVDSPEKALKVSDAIGERHVREGHPLFADEPHDFVHVPSTSKKGR